MVARGDTFLVPSGPGEYLHLHVICTGPRLIPDMRLLVPVSSIKEGAFHDPACVIEAGEHEFITKRSFVAYRHAQERSASKIDACLASGVFVAKPPMTADLLARILAGFAQSDFAAPWALRCLGDER